MKSKKFLLILCAAIIVFSTLIAGKSVSNYLSVAWDTLDGQDAAIKKGTENGDFAYTPLITIKDTGPSDTDLGETAPASPVKIPQSDGTAEISKDMKTRMILLEKMLNAVDYYDKVTIEFERAIQKNDGRLNIYCSADLQTGYALESNYDMNGILEYQSCCNGQTNISVSHFSQTYDVGRNQVLRRSAQDDISMENRITTASDGIPAYSYRRNITNCPLASYTLLPQELTYSYLKDFSTWEITGDETFCDRNCTVLEGTPCPYIQDKHQVDTFIMYVDAETGVLMRLIGISDGEARDMVLVHSITYGECTVTDETYDEILKTVVDLDYEKVN